MNEEEECESDKEEDDMNMKEDMKDMNMKEHLCDDARWHRGLLSMHM